MDSVANLAKDIFSTQTITKVKKKTGFNRSFLVFESIKDSGGNYTLDTIFDLLVELLKLLDVLI